MFTLLAPRSATRTVVVAVRDIYPIALASYSQGVKREGYAGEFGDFARTHVANGLRMGRGLRALRELLSPDELVVLHYEAIRSDLVPALLAAGGVPADSLDLSPGGSRSKPRNRSLSPGELRLLRRVNAEFGSAYSRMLSDMLEEREGALTGGGDIDRDALEFLSDYFEAEVEEINEAHFGGRDELKVIDPGAGGGPEPDPAEVLDDERDAASFLLRRLARPRSRLRHRKLRSLLRAGPT